MKLKLLVVHKDVAHSVVSLRRKVWYFSAVVMAGRSDGRGTALHLVGSGIWGGCFSLLAGIFTMMAESRLHPLRPADAKPEKRTFGHKFHVVPFYRPFFIGLFILSILGCCCAVVTLSISCALIDSTKSFCDYAHVYRLWSYFELVGRTGTAWLKFKNRHT